MSRKTKAELLAENHRLQLSGAWEPSQGHWLVTITPGERRYTLVGEFATLDEARVRVALELCADEAASAIVKRFSEGGYSASELTRIVLDAVARRYAEARP